MARLLGVVNQNAFYGEKHDINWIIDYDGKGGTKSYSPGVTEPWLTNGKRNVYIHPSAFDKGNDKLFVILGHEYVHTIDHDSGLFNQLYSDYRNQTIVHNIFEFRAYTWSAAAEQALGLGLGQAGQLQNFTGLIPKDYLGR